MLMRRGTVPETVWDYAMFHTELAGGYGSVERLSIPQPIICLFRWQDDQSTRLSRTAKHWCIVYAANLVSQPFRLFAHSIIIRERALPGDPAWRLQTLPRVPDNAWQRRIDEDTRLLRTAATAIQLGVIADELHQYRF